MLPTPTKGEAGLWNVTSTRSMSCCWQFIFWAPNHIKHAQCQSVWALLATWSWLSTTHSFDFMKPAPQISFNPCKGKEWLQFNSLTESKNKLNCPNSIINPQQRPEPNSQHKSQVYLIACCTCERLYMHSLLHAGRSCPRKQSKSLDYI